MPQIIVPLGAFDASALLASIWGILQVILGLGFVIFVHELGHFLAAKYFGVKCEKFYIGFDVPIRIGPLRLPAKLAHFQWGETEYGIGIIPLGGYVRMLGQDDDPRKAQEEAARIRKIQEGGEPGDLQVQLDPRSFPAKPVYARMVIISAGVIMNLIFAVLMGAVAFSFGVPYQPTIVGALIPGDPAWQNGIQVGDQFTQVGSMSQPNEELHFRDMMESVIIAGLSDETKPIPIVLQRGSEQLRFSIVGSKQHDPDRIRTMLGVRPTSTAVVEEGVILKPYRDKKENVESFGLKKGDVIVAINQLPLAVDERLHLPTDTEATRYMDSKINEPVTLTVERISEAGVEKKDVVVPPLAKRTVGLRFGISGVTAIQVDSPAAKAGLQVGDQLMEFQGKPAEDGATLYLEVLKYCGKEVVMKFRRPESGKAIELKWEVPALPTLIDNNLAPAPVGYELVGSGLTYGLTRTIIGVDAGSEGEKAGLQAGDTLAQFQFEAFADLEEKPKAEQFKKFPVDNTFSCLWMNEVMQTRPKGAILRVFVEREGKVIEKPLAIGTSDQYFLPGRGLMLQPASLIEKSKGLASAMQLGMRETGKRIVGVGTFLKLLGSGRVSRKAVGGPMMIVAQATSAASEGFTTLLMFLVLLSANLAILNFLPIPALDGGHMMFLIVESVIGKPVDENLQAKLTMGGVLCLLALMVFVFFNDSINMNMFGF